MKEFVCAVLLLFLVDPLVAKQAAPQVQVYSRTPGEFGKANILICHVSGFYPPEITIKLLKNGQEIPNASQTDLAFEENWHYHLTKHVPFTPESSGERFSCRVTHMGKPVDYSWEPDV
ncbi:beta-2-microglobulin-like [Leuresthes tenuis]|uniref:beta-2-microglobulin-like n=1 Tax=Leuresthes tenuis TaxID=355514 RepID=UPI003B515070